MTGTSLAAVGARAALAAGLALAALLAYEYVYHKSLEGRSPPASWVALLLISAISLHVGSFILGALAGSALARPAGAYGKLVLALCGLLGVWAAAILLQVGQNAVRARFGLPRRPIAWIRRWRRA